MCHLCQTEKKFIPHKQSKGLFVFKPMSILVEFLNVDNFALVSSNTLVGYLKIHTNPSSG